MDKAKLEQLKKLAQAATPGPWREISHRTSSGESTTYLGNWVEAENKDTYEGYTYCGMVDRNVCQINAHLNCRPEFWDENIWEERSKNMAQAHKNQAYLMAISPDVILELIAENERLQAENERLRTKCGE